MGIGSMYEDFVYTKCSTIIANNYNPYKLH